MAQNPLFNDLIEERVAPLVDSIKGFFGSFGLSDQIQRVSPLAASVVSRTSNQSTPAAGSGTPTPTSLTPSRTRESTSTSPSRPSAPLGPWPGTVGPLQANGHGPARNCAPGTGGQGNSIPGSIPGIPSGQPQHTTSYQGDLSWASKSRLGAETSPRAGDTNGKNTKSDWDTSPLSTSSTSGRRSPFHQTMLELGVPDSTSSQNVDDQSGPLSTSVVAFDVEEPDYSSLSTEKLGRIQFSVSYDFDAQTLTVKIMKAEGLAAKDLSGTSDPYVKISLLPDKKHTLTTNIKRKNLNPRWNEVFAFEGFPYNKVVTKTLYLLVLDYDRFSRDDPIGEVCLPLGDLDLAAGLTMWKTLAPCKGAVGKLGMLLLSLCYQPAAGSITIVIIKARNLKAKDINGLSDPYVKIWLMYEGKKMEKKKTEIKEKTLNPTYNDSFTFVVPYERIRQTSLVVSVMDYDRMGRNEAIGQLVLGPKSGPIEMKHWNEMFAKTRQPVAQWHILKDFG